LGADLKKFFSFTKKFSYIRAYGEQLFNKIFSKDKEMDEPSPVSDVVHHYPATGLDVAFQQGIVSRHPSRLHYLVLATVYPLAYVHEPNDSTQIESNLQLHHGMDSRDRGRHGPRHAGIRRIQH
jgi:hypothetical protein